MLRALTLLTAGVVAGLVALASSGPSLALAQESLDDIEQSKTEPARTAPGKAGAAVADGAGAPDSGELRGSMQGKATAEVNGYLDDRLGWSWIDPSRLLPTKDSPSLTELLEANIQLRVDLGAKTRFLYADLSLFYQGGWLFYGDDGKGGRSSIDNHDVPSLRPFVVTSELYGSWSPRPWLNVLIGKKRITWGSGFSFNPTDLINPPKDPTDPNFQRSGAWLARVEAPFEKFTLTGLVAPQVLYQQSGLPYAVLQYPDYPPSDSVDARDPELSRKPPTAPLHYLAAARLYMLLYDADVNLIYYFSNRYQNGFENKSRFGFSFSRYFFTDYELHVEALLSQGTARSYTSHGCATGVGPCDLTAPLSASKLDSSNWYPRVLVGTRRQFSDESLVSVEYYYQADGYSDLEFDDTLRLLARAKSIGLTSTGMGGGSTQMGGALPQKFSFDPLRRHYLIASYSKPHIFDDWSVSAVLVAGLRDLSGLFTPSLSWTPVEWLTLTAYGYIPIRGLGVGAGCTVQRRADDSCPGPSFEEYGLISFDWRALFEARAYY